MDVSKTSDKAFLRGLERTRQGFWNRLKRNVLGSSHVDQDLLDEIEAQLLQADVGLSITTKIIEGISRRVATEKYTNKQELKTLLQAEMLQHLPSTPTSDLTSHDKPYVILLVGVNGVGKTTSVAKIAYQYQQQGKSVLMGAADTFRAAAVDQLQRWGQRLEVPVYCGTNKDPSAVAFDTIREAQQHQTEIVIIDTAGRLHNKKPLMDELGKLRHVIGKALPGAPHEVLLVIDGSTGQNGLRQAATFLEITKVTGVVLTKLDGTAKGGIVFSIAEELQLPIRYVGLGEEIQNLHIFEKTKYVEALLTGIKEF